VPFDIRQVAHFNHYDDGNSDELIPSCISSISQMPFTFCLSVSLLLVLIVNQSTNQTGIPSFNADQIDYQAL
jgi:hypothetical protein